jgi:hypothetical protein
MYRQKVKAKNLDRKKIFFFDILKISDENSRIRIYIRIRIH